MSDKGIYYYTHLAKVKAKVKELSTIMAKGDEI